MQTCVTEQRNSRGYSLKLRIFLWALFRRGMNGRSESLAHSCICMMWSVRLYNDVSGFCYRLVTNERVTFVTLFAQLPRLVWKREEVTFKLETQCEWILLKISKDQIVIWRLALIYNSNSYTYMMTTTTTTIRSDTMLE